MRRSRTSERNQRRSQTYPEGIFETEVSGISHDGRGVARVDGKIVFLTLGLPSERVKFRYTYSTSKYDEGIVMEVLRASEDRVMPECDVYHFCGGCNLQHASQDAQLRYKMQTLKDHFSHFSGIAPEEWLPPLKSPKQYGYRNKARLSVRYEVKKGSILIGFRERNGRFITRTDSCPILHEKVGGCIELLKQFILSLSVHQYIPQIEVAVDETKAAFILRHLKPFLDSDLIKIRQFSDQNDCIIFGQSDRVDHLVLLAEPSKNIQSCSEYASMFYVVNGFKIEFQPNEFTQVNPTLNQKMLTQVLHHLDPQKDDIILDLFCGLGNFSLPIAQKCLKVVGIEGNKAMTVKALKNAHLNAFNNVSFYAANLFEPFMSESWCKSNYYQKLLIDPPRAGAEFVCQNIETINSQCIVYISCNPATLARDIGILVNQKGYYLSAVGIMDMFPHTAHVESMAVLLKSI